MRLLVEIRCGVVLLEVVRVDGLGGEGRYLCPHLVAPGFAGVRLASAVASDPFLISSLETQLAELYVIDLAGRTTQSTTFRDSCFRTGSIVLELAAFSLILGSDPRYLPIRASSDSDLPFLRPGLSEDVLVLDVATHDNREDQVENEIGPKEHHEEVKDGGRHRVAGVHKIGQMRCPFLESQRLEDCDQRLQEVVVRLRVVSYHLVLPRRIHRLGIQRLGAKGAWIAVLVRVLLKFVFGDGILRINYGANFVLLVRINGPRGRVDGFAAQPAPLVHRSREQLHSDNADRNQEETEEEERVEHFWDRANDYADDPAHTWHSPDGP